MRRDGMRNVRLLATPIPHDPPVAEPQSCAAAGIAVTSELTPIMGVPRDPLAAARNYVLGSTTSKGRPKTGFVVVPDQAEQRLLGVREAARWLGLSKSTLDKMRCAGSGPRFVRVTKRAIRYDPADLVAFAVERRRCSILKEAIADFRD